MKLYKALAKTIQAIANCENSGNSEWLEKWNDRLEDLEKLLPSGSGFDSGCIVILEKSNANKIVIQADFHHLDDNGFYCGWTEHEVVIRPSFQFGFELRVTGRNKDGIKDYIADTFHEILNQDVSC